MLPVAENVYFGWLLAAIAAALLIYVLSRSIKKLREQAQSQRSLVDIINRELPQTQCGQCGHAGCRPYARAISKGEAINKCPPGGATTARRLALLLNELEQSVDPAHGKAANSTVAYIREAECIGCTKCIQACPVDAILGGTKLMHTVVVSECTGCDLCVDPCPVDCIDLLPLPIRNRQWLSPLQTTSRSSAGLQAITAKEPHAC